MTMLMHTHNRPQRTTRSFAPQGPTANIAARVHLRAIKRFLVGGLVVLLAGAAVAAVIALKTAYYLVHFSH